MDASVTSDKNTTFIIKGRKFQFLATLAAGKLIHDILWEGNNNTKINFVFKIDPSRSLMKLGERNFHRQVNDGFLRIYDISKNFQEKFEIPKSGGSHEPYLILKPNHGYKNKKEIIQDLVEFGAEKKKKNYTNIDVIPNDSEFQSEIMPVNMMLDDSKAPPQIIPINQVLQYKNLKTLCLQGKNEDIVNLLGSFASQSIPILEKVMALDLLYTMNALIYNEQRKSVINVLAENVFFSLKSASVTIEEKQKTYGIMNQSIHRESYQLFIGDLIQDFKKISNVYYKESEIKSNAFIPMYAQESSDNILREVNDEYSRKRKIIFQS